jgi:hypothetical protein
VSENPSPESAAPVRVAPRLAVRHVQLVRALLAAIAALMVTFSPDHSASFGLAVFSGFAVSTAIMLGIAAWMAYPAGRRAAVACLAVLTILAGMLSGVPVWRTTAMFFGIVIVWAVLTGAIELVAGLRERRAAAAALDPQRRSDARDAITVGAFGLLLGVGVGVVPAGYTLDYFIDDADQWFTLTGTTLAVGIFGAYAAIVAVYLGIAALSPRREAPAAESATTHGDSA